MPCLEQMGILCEANPAPDGCLVGSKFPEQQLHYLHILPGGGHSSQFHMHVLLPTQHVTMYTGIIEGGKNGNKFTVSTYLTELLFMTQ